MIQTFNDNSNCMFSFWRFFFCYQYWQPSCPAKQKVQSSWLSVYAFCVRFFLTLSQSTKAMRTKEKRNNISSCQTMKKGPKVKTKSLIIYSIVERMHLLFLFYAFFSSYLSLWYIHTLSFTFTLVGWLFTRVFRVLSHNFMVSLSHHLFCSPLLRLSLSHSLP